MLSRMYALILASTALIALVHPQANAQSLETGNSLLERCKSSNAGSAVYCLGYISGVADTMAAGNVINNEKACFPASATEGLLVIEFQ